MSVSFKKLVEGVRKHGDVAVAGLRGALAEGTIRPADLDLGKLFVECFGYGEFTACRENKRMVTKVFEAGGAVNSDAFQNITQQFAYSTLMAAYDIPDRVFSKIIPSRPSKFKFERIPGVAHVGDEALVVQEGMNFPMSGTSDDWTDTPETRKRGSIIPVTKEAIFFEHTGLLLERLKNEGEWLGVNKEKRAITCVIDGGETSNLQYQYKWRNVSYATYQAATPWINLQATNALSDYTTIQKAWQLLVQILDPFTKEPQNVTVKHIVVPPALAMTVPFALKGMVKRMAPGYATSGNPTGTEVNNPVADVIGNIQTVSTQLFKSATNSDSTWFLGDMSEAFEYVENWPIQVLNLGAGSHDEFHRDIVMQFRADERGTFNTKQPRKMVKCTA